jgi:hypothetical protein
MCLQYVVEFERFFICHRDSIFRSVAMPLYIFKKNIQHCSGHVEVDLRAFRKFPLTSPSITYETTLKITSAIKRMRPSLNICRRPIALLRQCCELKLYSRYIHKTYDNTVTLGYCTLIRNLATKCYLA